MEQQEKTTYKKPVGKNKKIFVTVVIFAAVLAVAGLVIFLAWPYIQSVISPKKRAILALKNAGTQIEEYMGVYLERSGETGSKQNLSGYVEFEKLTRNDKDYLGMINVNTVQYDVFFDSDKGISSGVIGASVGNNQSLITGEYYLDKENIYVSVPKLVETKLKKKISDYYDKPQNTEIAKAVKELMSNSEGGKELIHAMVEGYCQAVEEFEYEKLEKVYLEESSYSESATKYSVCVTKENLIRGIGYVIDKIYEDTALTSYTSLLSAVGKVNKEELKNMVPEMLADIDTISFDIYVTNDNKLAGIDISLSQFKLNYSGAVSVRKYKDSDSEFVVIDYKTDEIAKDLQSENEIKLSDSKVTVYKKDTQRIITVSNDAEITRVELTYADNIITISNCSSTVTSGKDTYSVVLKGIINVSSGAEKKVSLDNFEGAKNIDELDSIDKLSMLFEVLGKQELLKEILSDDLYKKIAEPFIAVSQSGAA